MNNDLGIVIDSTISREEILLIVNLYQQFSTFSELNQFVMFTTAPSSLNDIPQLPIEKASFFKGNILLFNNNMLLFAKNFFNYNRIIYYMTKPNWLFIAANNSNKSIKSLYNETRDLQIHTNNKNVHDLYKNMWGDNINLGDLSYEKTIY